MRKRKPNRKKKDIIFLIMAILLVTAGVSLLLYPTVSNWWNQRHMSKVIAGYTDTICSLSEIDYQKMKLEAQKYNENLLKCPNRYYPTEEESEWYRSLLNITEDGMMGYIEIPRTKVNLPIYHSTDDTVLQVAVGHMEGSSLPTGGSSTHAILSGHRGLPSARLFTDLDVLELGDKFYINVFGERHEYVIDDISIVLPNEMQSLEITEGQDYCTLVTCTPYGINTHRLLVRGIRAS